MRILFAGTPQVAVPTLEALAESPHELVGVLTQPDARRGRGRKVARSQVAQWAENRGLDVWTPTTLRTEEAHQRLRELDVDLVVVVAYGKLVPREALDIPRLGWINLHFSLLPAWRGAAPVQHAVLSGDDMTGASVFQLEAGMDTGPVFGMVTDSISSRDTSGDVLERLSVSGARLAVDVVNALAEDDIHARPQSSDGVSLAPKITSADARVRWSEPAFAVDRRVRAVTPTPGAWTEWQGERFRLGPVTVDKDGPRLEPGRLETTKKSVFVGTATDPVRLGTVQPAGKKAMDATAWARGIQESDGRFE
ncbi:methionyl-tRNA formyltransferase [Haloglycomyces albus]|uniref:methionyl-tRNA formyltransferase n=1 Tax=Haloglycomyces albus TaxID=526067 RepID=UPI00046D1B0D|nr:methionyl-tRNA formyltransferase [Haloglycomyces albus]